MEKTNINKIETGIGTIFLKKNSIVHRHDDDVVVHEVLRAVNIGISGSGEKSSSVDPNHDG